MAQSLSEIYQEIITAKEANAQLSSLDAQAGENMDTFVSEISTSRVSIWRLWAFIVSFKVWLIQKTDDTFRLEFEQRARLKQQTTLKWYQDQVLAYLYGKPLVWNTELDKFEQQLAPTDDANALRIVKFCAVVPAPFKLRVKVAKDNNGVPGTLATAEATALATFLNQIKAAGDTIELVNNSPDQLNIALDVYVNPLEIDLATGELLAQPGTKPAEDAINAYLQQLHLDFNNVARFKRTRFVDYLQHAQGVTDVDINTLQWRYGAFPYTDIDVSVVPDAGYFEIDSLTINYLPAES